MGFWKNICNIVTSIAAPTIMRKTLIFSILSLFFLLQQGELQAQDPAFSQYYANPIYLNPALAGNKICPRFTLNYRNQWPAMPANFVTYSAAYDQYLPVLHGGVAIMAMADNAGNGSLTSMSISGAYSYRLIISRSLIANAGIQVAWAQNQLDWDKLQFEDQIDSRLGFVNPTSEIRPENLSKSYVDFSSGFTLGYKERYYIGAAVHHLSEPNIGFYSNQTSTLDMKITAHAGALFYLENPGSNDLRALSVSPNLMYVQQKGFHQVNVGAYLNKYPFVLGVWYRNTFDNPDALIALVGFQQSNFKLGYSYDFTVSGLENGSTGGAHEISFAWLLPCPQKTYKIKAIKCPRF